MKIFVAIMINGFTFFQQEKSLSKAANINLPQKSVRLSKNELAAIGKRRFKTFLAMLQYASTYDVGRVLLGFEDYTKTLRILRALKTGKKSG